MQEVQVTPVGHRIRQLAELHPDKAAIILVEPTGDEIVVTSLELERRSNQVADLLSSRGVAESKLVIVALPNSANHYFATFGTWKAGGCVLWLRPDLSARERSALIELANPMVVVADWPEVDAGLALTSQDLESSVRRLAAPILPDRVPHPGKAVGSGGSTGRPKIIIDPRPWGMRGDATSPDLGMTMGQTQLVVGGLFHNAPVGWSTRGVLADHELVVMAKFSPEQAVALIQKHHVQFLALAPIMMQRILRVAGISKPMFASVESVMHTGAPCPAWVKRGWIDLIGAERVHEGFGATEDVGATNIRGDEWLLHPGSVGRPIKFGNFGCELKILDEDLHEVPPGTVGEIFMRPLEHTERFRYIGSPPPKMTSDGFVSVGDMGHVDEGGWLYLADRRVDMIVSGGINVYPAEIEAVLSEHPGVSDSAVIGVPDEEWGLRVHAIVLASDPSNPPTVDELDAACRRALAAYKAPKSYEFVAAFPRDEAGKVQRSKLAADRTASWTPAMRPVNSRRT